MSRLYRTICVIPFIWLIALTAAQAENGSINIDAEFQEVHHVIGMELESPIVWTYHLNVALSGQSSVKESWDSHSNTGFTKNATHQSSFGVVGNDYVWHILGPSKLVRFSETLQTSMIMQFTINNNKDCALKVVYKLKRGFSDMLVPAAGNNVMTHFSLPKPLSASCTIS